MRAGNVGMEGGRITSHSMSGRNYGLKRREPDDLVLDLQNVSLSPTKKLRVSESGVNAVAGPGSNFAAPQSGETPGSLLKGPSTPVPTASASVLSPTPLRADPMLASPPPASEQNALVLYRPVNPPLFPGGPPYGSMDLSFRVNPRKLPIPQGTDNGRDPSYYRKTTCDLSCQSPPFSNDMDILSGCGLFQALDLSGGPSLLPGQKRLSRVWSCSSLPRFSFTLDDQPMVEEIDDKSAQLAVIPWAPTTVIIPSDAKPVIEEVDDGPSDIPDVEEMADSESMEVVNDDIIVTEAESTTMGGQFGSPLPSFGAAPWQQCEILQPPFSKVMWSH